MKIFVSYASQRRAEVEPIALALNAEGHDVFFDRDDLPAGETYNDQIRTAIEACDLAIFLISPESVAGRRYTLTELKFLRNKWPNPSQRVLPVMLVQTPFEKIPAYLKTVNVLEAEGNLAAEVAAEVGRIAKITAASDSGTPTKRDGGRDGPEPGTLINLDRRTIVIVAAGACITVLALSVILRSPHNNNQDGQNEKFPATLQAGMDKGSHWKLKRRGDDGESVLTLISNVSNPNDRGLYFIDPSQEAEKRGVVNHTRFFVGKKVGSTYEGKVWLHAEGCGPVKIDVAGPTESSSDGIFITLQGEERTRNESCEDTDDVVTRIWELEFVQ